MTLVMTYRAGIIGTGGVAGLGIYRGSADDIGTDPVDRSHAGGFDATSDIELVAVADIDEDALDRFGNAWNIPPDRRYGDHESLLEAESLDIVSICTPSMLHRDHVEAAATIGTVDAIWCEKPIACSVKDAEAAVSACDQAGVELVINHSRRFVRQNQSVRQAITNGVIGDLESYSLGSSMELFRVGTHVIDLLVYLFETQADSVQGYVTGRNESAEHLTSQQIDDAGAAGTITHPDGTVGTFDCTPPRDVAEFFARFHGTEGRLHWGNGEQWQYQDREDDTFIDGDPPTAGYSDDHTQSFANAAAHLVDVIEGTTENISSGSQAIHTLEILIGTFISHYTGSRISLPLDDPLKDVTITSW